MIDRLHDVLPYLEQLPPEIQEEAATYIEALAEALEREAFVFVASVVLNMSYRRRSTGKTQQEHGVTSQTRCLRSLTRFDMPTLQPLLWSTYEAILA